MKRPTIHDIAREAGVAKSTVSFALNGQPGVSESTRQRILAVARELGWQPSRAARALSAAQAEVVGLVLARPTGLLEVEPFFMRLIAGVEAALGADDIGLLLQVVGDDPEREMDVYRRWWGQRRVDGVLVVDVRVRDQRLPLLSQLGLPCVLVSSEVPGSGLTSVGPDTKAAMVAAVSHLHSLGHTRIARVAGNAEFQETVRRDQAFVEAAGPDGVVVAADFTGEGGAAATRGLLLSGRPPTAIVYDNDLMAVSAVGVAAELGLDVPGDLSIIAWDDSPLCRLPHPALTAMSRDISGYGSAAAAALLRVIAGEGVPDSVFGVAELVVRGSTGPA
ncbi:LacI family DNA-binding transcriptional regulator [Kutzneria sp. NPDC051319]|uniref:LacI family DNA-binding transcriptional regulator n=1 Tax=Kutzneria sp. NPDC051319 TaxID=3155047 RepID=UPI0034392781